ncbi:MAG: phosphatase PAP2 family protein [Bacteroidales bacterium]|nr:phosphatase PAP2 family protein [Bacteroidales bacterium]
MERHTPVKQVFLLVFTIFIVQVTFAQNNELKSQSVYKINRKVEIPVTVGLFIGNIFGFEYLEDKPLLDSMEIAQLDANEIWKFDRIATEQDALFISQAEDISDIALNITVALPALLALDNDIRKDWLDLLILYGETHAINSSVYILTAGMFNRIRPFVYNPDVPYVHKTGSGTRNSFFSGHVSTTASASFFMAKVYSDYHPELGNKKLWLFGAALIPPAIVSFYRYKAMKHFPTDVIYGVAIGAAAGILIPHFHKIKKDKSSFSFIPFAGGVSGLKVSYSVQYRN